MKRKTFACLFLAGLIGSAAWAQTADEIIAKNIEAKGGREKIKALQSIRMTGTLVTPMGELPLVMEAARPNKVRQEFTLQGMTGIQAYDGTTGWMVMPFMGKKDPEQVPSDMLKQLEEQAEFDGMLMDYAEKGHKVEYLGKEDIEGTPAHKLKVTRKSGDTVTLYLDAESFLEIKAKTKTTMQGQEFEGEANIGDYKDVGGLLFPHSIEQTGPQGKVTITFSKIELNPEIPADRFTMPAKPAEAPAPKPQ